MQLSKIVNKYITHDARQLDTLLPRGVECIDVTVTSPPYWNIKDYGHKRQIGFGQSYEHYLADVENVFTRIYEATKPSGSLWIVADTLKEDGVLRLLPFDIANRIRAAGWILQDIIIWQKDRTLPWSHQGKLRNIFEYIAFYSKTRDFHYNVSGIRDIADLKDYWVRYPERYSPEGKAPSRSWHIPIPRQGSWGVSANYVRHACPLPPELVERILRLTTKPGDLVIDPFAGSGTVLATANAMGRRFVGTDLNAAYRRMFYRSVLPNILARYRERQHIDLHQATTKEKFTAAVLALRCLKYPKELARLYRAKHGTFPTDLVFALPSRSRRDLKVIISLPKQSRLTQSTFLKRLESLTNEPPLSKYGLRPQFVVGAGPKDLGCALRAARVGLDRKLTVYRDGQFFRPAESTTARSLVDGELGARRAATAGYPRIVSTLDIAIDPKDTGKFFEG